jgi:hypothetical protein
MTRIYKRVVTLSLYFRRVVRVAHIIMLVLVSMPASRVVVQEMCCMARIYNVVVVPVLIFQHKHVAMAIHLWSEILVVYRRMAYTVIRISMKRVVMVTLWSVVIIHVVKIKDIIRRSNHVAKIWL